jgi:hypothetical protein
MPHLLEELTFLRKVSLASTDSIEDGDKYSTMQLNTLIAAAF